MGRATIIAHMGEGQYRVWPKYDWSRLEAELASLDEKDEAMTARRAEAQAAVDRQAGVLDQAAAALNALITQWRAGEIGEAMPDPEDSTDGDLYSGGELERIEAPALPDVPTPVTAAVKEHATAQITLDGLRADLAEIEAGFVTRQMRRQALDAERTRLDGTEITAWCSDYTLDINPSTTVATIEAPGYRPRGEPSLVLAPGGTGTTGLGYGQLRSALTMTPEMVALNLALEPGHLKWKPRWRYGRITSISDSADVCNVALEQEWARRVDVAPKMTLTETLALDNVPIRYMTCHRLAFKVGDQVVVEWQGDDPVVIGFRSHPRPCAMPFWARSGATKYLLKPGESPVGPVQAESAPRVWFGRSLSDTPLALTWSVGGYDLLMGGQRILTAGAGILAAALRHSTAPLPGEDGESTGTEPVLEAVLLLNTLATVGGYELRTLKLRADYAAAGPVPVKALPRPEDPETGMPPLGSQYQFSADASRILTLTPGGKRDRDGNWIRGHLFTVSWESAGDWTVTPGVTVGETITHDEQFHQAWTRRWLWQAFWDGDTPVRRAVEQVYDEEYVRTISPDPECPWSGRDPADQGNTIFYDKEFTRTRTVRETLAIGENGALRVELLAKDYVVRETRIEQWGCTYDIDSGESSQGGCVYREVTDETPEFYIPPRVTEEMTGVTRWYILPDETPRPDLLQYVQSYEFDWARALFHYHYPLGLMDWIDHLAMTPDDHPYKDMEYRTQPYDRTVRLFVDGVERCTITDVDNRHGVLVQWQVQGIDGDVLAHVNVTPRDPGLPRMNDEWNPDPYPLPGPNKRATTLNGAAVFGEDAIDAMGVLTESGCPWKPDPAGIAVQPVCGGGITPSPEAVIQAHNAYRRARGLPELRQDSTLMASTQAHCNWMVANDSLTHAGEDGSQVWDRAAEAGWTGDATGENLARGQTTVEQVMADWDASPGHQANMQDERWDSIGVAIATDSQGRLVYCVNFGDADP